MSFVTTEEFSVRVTGPIVAVYCVRLLHAITRPFQIFSNLIYFCPNFQTFCLFVNISFLVFGEIAPMPLVSRIVPGSQKMTSRIGVS